MLSLYETIMYAFLTALCTSVIFYMGCAAAKEALRPSTGQAVVETACDVCRVSGQCLTDAGVR
jgi:hypothetical protein